MAHPFNCFNPELCQFLSCEKNIYMKIGENFFSNTIGYSILVWSELLMNRPHVSEYNASTLFKVSEFFNFF